ncbi:MAG: MerR family transcriptional regulator [Coprobacillaceae bacterium]
MEKYYTTGQFAKKASTTERTIRYYDKIGLLKPTKILDNGYRQYSERDFLQLQKITALQHLGFSLEEIYPMLLENNPEKGFEDSIALQIDIVDKKINYLEGLKESLLKTNQLLKQGTVQWDRVADLIKLSNEENMIIQYYKSTSNLLRRIELHNKYSTNPVLWFTWVYQQIDFLKTNKLLEIGCGNGELWKQNKGSLRHREFFLTDINNNMLEDAKKNLGSEYNYMIMDCQNITFKNQYFDNIVANHVLFYLDNLERGLKEIYRVLKKDGILYCTAYSKNHMHEIELLVNEYNNEIKLVESNLYEKFGLENGEEILNKYFDIIEFRKYDDCLKIDNCDVLIDYIMSCPGNQNEIIGKNIIEFKEFIRKKLSEYGYIKVTKEAGIFICKK